MAQVLWCREHPPQCVPCHQLHSVQCVEVKHSLYRALLLLAAMHHTHINTSTTRLPCALTCNLCDTHVCLPAAIAVGWTACVHCLGQGSCAHSATSLRKTSHKHVAWVLSDRCCCSHLVASSVSRQRCQEDVVCHSQERLRALCEPCDYKLHCQQTTCQTQISKCIS